MRSAFASKHGLDEERAIAAFLHAARVGMFDISWNVLCPGCGGVLDTNATLKTVQKDEYTCALCCRGLFADARRDGRGDLHRSVRACAGSPPTIHTNCRCRNISGRSTGAPASICRKRNSRRDGRSVRRWRMSSLRPAKRRFCRIQLAVRIRHRLRAGHAFSAVHRRQGRADARAPEACRWSSTATMSRTRRWRCDPARCALRWKTGPTPACCRRVFIAGDALHDLLGKRRPFLTAKRLLTNQTFRDLYRTDTLDVDQRLKITSLTFLFTDLRGSTALYERVGDLVAFDLVRAHFQVLHEIVAAEAGAVVKTIGDAVMATFPTPDRAIAAALRMREAMRALNEQKRARGPAAQDRRPCRPLHRRDHERAAGLFRPDGQHRLARPEPCQLAGDLRHRRRGRRQSHRRPVAQEGADARVARGLVARHRAGDSRSIQSPDDLAPEDRGRRPLRRAGR